MIFIVAAATINHNSEICSCQGYRWEQYVAIRWRKKKNYPLSAESFTKNSSS